MSDTVGGVAPEPVAAASRLRIEEVDTPSVIIDLDRVEGNIAKLQAFCARHGVACRPHVKTHKLPFLARKQLAAGAAGITVQTLGEAEVMAAAGCDDLLITYDLMGASKVRRLAQVARLASVRVAVDNAVALAAVAQGARLAERRIGVLVEFECGKLRQGVVTPEEVVPLAQQATTTPELEFLGLLTYPNAPAVAPFVARARELLAREGIAVRVVSAGGTPTLWNGELLAGLTEYRAGLYVYHDRKSVADGVAGLGDCALHVHVTVVSRPAPDRGVIDAGSKTLTSDALPGYAGTGYGTILEYPDAQVTGLTEEHGMVDFSRCRERPGIGERVRVIPNHACPVSNLHDEVFLHRGGFVEAVLPVAARGMTR